ncbi:heterokaryon incompatibility protein-domain-containing protein [Dactylonectria macrodidyma]|uniref:Heterokaryon incompatibility protein-domain-containing protein n=1 Tax=Dactylonectria macrodidyma TaxID=307937 RepID=A0A9P9DX25_9HYPO|nr:heterokaryon incompatibility protein-domain-containing protein [Dactylonectria macrodidyma]
MDSNTAMHDQLSSEPSLSQRLQRLTIENGTICSFCHESCSQPPPTDTPCRKRALSELVDAARFCGYCALWMRSLEASANAIMIEDGQDAALRAHPLTQSEVPPEDIELEYINVHDWIDGGIEQRIAWPHWGTIWATLDLCIIPDSSIINLGRLNISDQSDTVWNGIKFWITECSSHHTNCRLERNTVQKPTRLLHLGSPSSPMEVRLVEGKSIPSGTEYLTLSHCWGHVQPLQLTSQTIGEFKTSLPVEKLPKTFLQACHATRRLGHEYLWIDSLCIVQDDPGDWALEAGRMASIYGNSFLTIAAAAAEDATQGLFYPHNERNTDAWLPALIHRSWGGPFSGDFYVCDYRSWWTQLGDAPLHRRGWACQERMLSPRVLHLGLEQVAFECPSMTACERLPYGDLGHIMAQLGGPGSRVKRFLDLEWEGGNRLSEVNVLLEWNELVRNYASRRFTVETDKMVALTGVVDSFERLFHSHQQSLFLGGLWRPRIEMQLAWRATSKVQSHQLSGNAPPGFGTRPRSYIAPSWSWCSLNNAPVEPQQSNPVDLPLTKVLDVTINPTPQVEEGTCFKYCCAPGSSLRLRCSLVPVRGYGAEGGILLPSFDGGEAKQLESRNYWDASFDDEASKAELSCLVPTFVDMSRVTKPVHGLILELHLNEDSGEKYFTRLGVFVLDDLRDAKKMWDSAGEFDRSNAERHVDAPLHDGINRLAEDGRSYTQEDGVLQHVIDIQ